MHVCCAATSENIRVSATIEKGCVFHDSGTVLDFGTHPTSSRKTNVTASIVNNRSTWSVECTPEIPVDFGSTALVSKLETINGSAQIICSAQTPYSVGLSDGQHFNTTRRMKHQSEDNYIKYEVYKNWSPQRWGECWH